MEFMFKTASGRYFMLAKTGRKHKAVRWLSESAAHKVEHKATYLGPCRSDRVSAIAKCQPRDAAQFKAIRDVLEGE